MSRRRDDEAALQEAIRDSAEEWRLTVDAVESPLLLVDLAGRVRRLNLAASRLAGRTYRELLGRPLRELGTAEPWRAAVELVATVAREGASRTVSVVDPARGVTWDLAASRATGFRPGEDRVTLVIRDITHVVRLQESLRRSEMMSAMGSLVAGVAHEVRNPLFGISAALDAFESRLDDRHDYLGYLYVLRSQLQRLNHLMQQLLDYGKPARPAVSEEDLASILAEAVTDCAATASQAGVSVVQRLPPDLLRLRVDRAQLVQVLVNLLENAIQHSPPGAAVEVEGLGSDEGLVCRVLDRGPGFAPEDLQRVCEPFFSRRPAGTGLGLSIVQRVVEQHGGTLAIGNRPGGGARVELRLPAVVEPAAVPVAASGGDS